MHSLMVIDRFYPIKGGAELQAQRLANALIKKGNSVSVFTTRFKGLEKTETVDGIRIIRVKTSKNQKLSYIVFLMQFLMHLLFNYSKYNLLHFHGISMFAGVMAKAGKLFGLPSLAKTTTAGDVAAIKKFGSVWTNLLKNIKVFICTSEEQEKEILENIPNAITVSLPNGVDTVLFKPVKQKKNMRTKLGLPEKMIFCYSGRLVKRKGLMFLLKNWKEAVRIYPQAHLIILGSGKLQSDSSEEELKEFVIENNLEDFVSFKGEVNNTNEYLQASNIFIFPSQREGLPNALLEAMACGLPVIVSKIGGNIDIISEKKDGLFFESGNKKELLTCISQVLKNKKFANMLGKNARAKILKEYSLDFVADKYNSIYQQLSK